MRAVVANTIIQIEQSGYMHALCESGKCVHGTAALHDCTCNGGLTTLAAAGKVLSYPQWIAMISLCLASNALKD